MVMIGRDSHRGSSRSRRAYGRSASLLWHFRRALPALVFDGSANSFSKWRRRALSSARWRSGFALEVGFHFGRFGSMLALPATRDVDAATSKEWLSIDGVAVGWIDVGGGLRFGLVMWGKRGDLTSCALVALVALMVPSASPATMGLLRLGWCGPGSWSGFEARPGSLPCWTVTLFCFYFLFPFMLVFGSVIRSQISPSFFESGLLSEIWVRVWFWVIGLFSFGPNLWTAHCRAIDYQPVLMTLTLMSMLNAWTGHPNGTPDQLCCLLVILTQFNCPILLLLGYFDWSAHPLSSEDM